MKPTVEQFFELVDQVKAGRVTTLNFQGFLEKPDRFLPTVFAVTVNYGRTLQAMIKDGHYDWSNDDITHEHFPINRGREEKDELKLTLFHPNRPIESDEAIDEMAKQGLRPATLPELLALGEEHPDLQREFPIIALGSVWQGRGGDRDCPCLDESAGERHLYLRCFGGEWDERCRFLAVPVGK